MRAGIAWESLGCLHMYDGRISEYEKGLHGLLQFDLLAIFEYDVQS